MSLTSRSSRRTSCSITSSSFSRWSSRLGDAQRADGRAQRGQRVLDLVRDIGRELFVAVDPVVERRDHAAQRARQAPDLVGPRGQVGDADPRRGDILRALRVAADLGRGGQVGQRVGDGRGQDQAEADRDQRSRSRTSAAPARARSGRASSISPAALVIATTPTALPPCTIGVATVKTRAAVGVAAIDLRSGRLSAASTSARADARSVVGGASRPLGGEQADDRRPRRR